MLVAVMAALAVPTLLTATTKCYDVVPYKNFIAQTDTAPPNDKVSQYFRMTVDSVTEVSFWVGDAGDTSKPFNVRVLDSITGHRVAHREGWHTGRSWAWMNVPLYPDPVYKPVRGRTYLVEVTRPQGGAISYAYDPRESTYAYGCLVVGNDAHPTEDLALRVSGLHDAVGADWLSVQVHSSGTGSALALARDELGVTWVGDDLGHWNAWDGDPAGVRSRCSTCVAMGFEVRGMLAYGNPNDSLIASAPPGIPESLIGAYPPRNLFAPLTDDTNYWAGYCRGIMDNLDMVRYWAVLGEPNADWNWDDPDTHYYRDRQGGPIDTPRERCSLYVQMCHIAKQTAESLGNGQKGKRGTLPQFLV